MTDTTTATSASLLRQIEALTSQIDDLIEQRTKALDEWCVAACPHKPGDIVPCGSFSHRGKSVYIYRVTWYDASAPRWRVYGRIVKSDGKPGLITVDWCDR